jgi:hypothetical protein
MQKSKISLLTENYKNPQNRLKIFHQNKKVCPNKA